MEIKIDQTINGDDLHKKFMGIAQDYGIMITGVRACIIGEMQAEITLAGMKEVDKHQTDIIENKINGAKDAMLEPSNSCGNQSNQICDLFLGDAESKKFSKKPYEIISGSGMNLSNIIDANEKKDILVRLEVDRAVTPDVILKSSAIKNESTLQKIVQDDSRNRNKIFLLPDSLYHVDDNGKINKLNSNETEKQALTEIFNRLEDSNGIVVIDDEFLEENAPDLQGRAMYDLNKISKNQMANAEYNWCANHSYTLFIPEAKNEKRTFYPYQAFANRHTLQQ